MSKLVEDGVQAMCPHAAQVQVSAAITRVTMGGVAPLAQDDTYSISGCPFNIGGSPQPCIEIQWLTATTRVTAEGKALLLDDSTGLCQASGKIPQGPPQLVVTQQRVEAK